jgi:hypothetical protein
VTAQPIVEAEEVIAHKVRVAMQQLIKDTDVDLRHTPDACAALELRCQRLGRNFLMELRSHVLAVGDTTTHRSVRYPATWWQAVRERFAPGWWLARYPVRHTVCELEVTAYAAVCPHHNEPSPKPHKEFLSWITMGPMEPLYREREEP